MKLITKTLFIILLIGFQSCQLENERQEYAEILINNVENFKKEKSRLPINVSELGLIEEMDSPAFYQKKTDSTYIVWYGLSVGESKVYKSSTKKWTKEG